MSDESNSARIGPFELNKVALGDSFDLVDQLPDESIDVAVTSPPYWGQRLSAGMGVEDDPRNYLRNLTRIFSKIRPKLKSTGLMWINIGDAYNTPVNWREDDRKYSGLGPNGAGLSPGNSAYVKPRARRKAYIDPSEQWLSYGSLLGLPLRLVLNLCDAGYIYRGEIIWYKKNPMPEGRCRRPHREHEAIHLFAKSEGHSFRTTPPVKSVWEFPNEKIDGPAHYSRFPQQLPMRCIEAYGIAGPHVVVLDPFSGSGTTGVAALGLGCSYIGFEIDSDQVKASNARLRAINGYQQPLIAS